MKIFSEDNTSFTYLSTIKRIPYLVTVSKSGDLLSIVEYSSNEEHINVAQSNRNIEFG